MAYCKIPHSFKYLQDCKYSFTGNLLCELPRFLLPDSSKFSIHYPSSVHVQIISPLFFFMLIALTDTPLKAFVTPLSIKLGIFCLLSSQNHYTMASLTAVTKHLCSLVKKIASPSKVSSSVCYWTFLCERFVTVGSTFNRLPDQYYGLLCATDHPRSLLLC